MDTIKNLFSKLTGKPAPTTGDIKDLGINQLETLTGLNFPVSKETVAAKLEAEGANPALVRAIRMAEKRNFDSLNDIKATVNKIV